MTLKPPKPKRIYVVIIDPDAKPRKVTKSLSVYSLTLEQVVERIRKTFEEVPT